MKKQWYFLLLVFLTLRLSSYGQNLPSLLTERNINSTFSILAYDEKSQEWGIAVATDNIYVGNSTIYIEPNVGAFSVIAETEPKYGTEGLKNLREGKSIEQAILSIRESDNDENYRQVSGIDQKGNVFAFTGNSLKYWKGQAATYSGKHYVVMGNQLAEGVIVAMSKTFETAKGTLAKRLLKSLIAGQNAGGQITGKQSAAIVVKGSNNEWYNQIDLRVDNSRNPFKELQTLINYHYGRIGLNQAIFAHREGNITRAKQKLMESETMLNGWTGIYSRIAGVHIAMGNENAAVDWIEKGLEENPNWSINIPAFYCLKDNPRIKSIIDPESFSISDWEGALGMLSNLGREIEVIELAESLIKKGIDSSYLNFLLGRGYYYEKEQNKAIKQLEKALKIDVDNIEARNLLNRIQR